MPAQIRGYGYAGSPLLWEHLVILNVGTGLALDRDTGAVIWQHEGLAGLATPVLYLDRGQRRVLIFAGKAFFARDARTGGELWSIPWETRLAANETFPIATAPDVHDAAYCIIVAFLGALTVTGTNPGNSI